MSKVRSAVSVLVAMSACLTTAACIGSSDSGDSSGNADGHTGPCAVLTVAIGPTTAAGNVTSDPGGIQCPLGSCWASYGQGTTVNLTAQALDGWRFVGWDGDCSGAGVSTAVTLDTSKNCNARFEPIQAGTADGGSQNVDDAGAGDAGGSPADGAVSTGGDSWSCCAPANSKLSFALCPNGGDQCCLATTLLECGAQGGVWMATSSCTTTPPAC
jgi:hypothetical protein